MMKRSSLGSFLGHWFLRNLKGMGVVLIVLYFVMQSLTGQNGLISGINRYQEWQQKKNELEALNHQIQDMQKQTQALRPSHLDLDLIQEYIRSDLGYAYPNETMIHVRPLPQTNTTP